MKLNSTFILIFLFISVFGCSKEDHAFDHINLPENIRLEDTDAGWWIKELNLQYDAQDVPLTTQIHKHLISNATQLDTYQTSVDDLTVIWEYCGSKCINLVEEIYKSAQGENIWISYEYPIPGAPWRDVLPEIYTRIKTDQEYGQVAVIESKADKARLFLFGSGNYCRRMSIF
jgi:hypothetical protein